MPTPNFDSEYWSVLKQVPKEESLMSTTMCVKELFIIATVLLQGDQKNNAVQLIHHFATITEEAKLIQAFNSIFTTEKLALDILPTPIQDTIIPLLFHNNSNHSFPWCNLALKTLNHIRKTSTNSQEVIHAEKGLWQLHSSQHVTKNIPALLKYVSRHNKERK